MTKIADSMLELVGATPMVRLNKPRPFSPDAPPAELMPKTASGTPSPFRGE